MKILLVGSGGREHAIAKALSLSPLLTKLYIAPGNAGTTEFGENVPIPDTHIIELAEFAKNHDIDLTFVGPEAPLTLGIVDLFEEKGLTIVGPNKLAAQLEGSKEWAKMLMKKCNIPTASYEVFYNADIALGYLDTQTFPLVIKADGLAAGKGVTIAHTKEEAQLAIEDCLVHDKFAEAGQKIIIESFLEGEEASIFAFCDGETILPMVPAQDHKAIYDGDKGPNTGGMGAYSPAPIVTPEVEQKVLDRVFKPLLKGFKDQGITYKGIVYAGLMIDSKQDPYVVEFNARFGDPETQVVLPRLCTDLIKILTAIAETTLNNITLEWTSQSAVCVVLAAGGYPGNYEKGKEIKGLKEASEVERVHVIHAGTKLINNKVVTNGGRVLGVISQGSDLKSTIDQVYKGVEKISFDGKYNRTDIGQKAFRHI